MRTFVAVNLPAAERAALDLSLQPLRDVRAAVRWTAPEALHLTLRFLGELSEARVAEVVAALSAVGPIVPPFAMQLRGFGAFPDAKRARIWWVGIEPAEPLLALHRRIAAALQGIGFDAEERRFHPHVTVARATRDAGREDARALASAAHGLRYSGNVEVLTFELMKSETRPSGARYTAIASFDLEG